MRKFTLIIFLLSIFKLSHGQIVIKRETSNLAFFYTDYFNNLKDNRMLRNEKREVDGYITIPVDYPVLVTLTKGMTSFPVYLEPGDTCTVSENESKTEYVLTGNKSSGELNFLIALERKFGFTFPDFSVTLTSKLNISEYMKMHQELYDNRIKFLDRFRDSLQISNSFYTSMQKNIYYKYLTGTLMPFYVPAKDFDYNSLPADYIAKVNVYKAAINDSLANQLRYRLFLLNYNKFLSKHYLKSSDPYTFESLFNSAKNNFTGKSREYLMFLILKENVSKALPDFYNYVLDFKKRSSDRKFVDYIDSVWTKTFATMPIAAKETGFENESNEFLTWPSLVELAKGKVIYVDFWASWCGPCIAEMPNSVALQNKVDDEKVKFVYISIDSKKDSWLNALKKLPTEVRQSDHYRLDANSDLGRFFDLTSIPRYVIIDTDGKIAGFDAGRPGSDDTLAAIRKLFVK